MLQGCETGRGGFVRNWKWGVCEKLDASVYASRLRNWTREVCAKLDVGVCVKLDVAGLCFKAAKLDVGGSCETGRVGL